MKTKNGATTAPLTIAGCRDRLQQQVAARLEPLFRRREAAANFMTLIGVLCSEVVRKNCWTLAELAGHLTPDRLQHVLSRAKWDHAEALARLRMFVAEHLGSDDVVLVVDETGDVKKGRCAVGVQRQYTGTAGRIENAQVAVYLTYATAEAHALIDERLYLPQAWIDDIERRSEAHVPQETEFTTKPDLAAAMITDALDAGVQAGWVAGDEVYGAHAGLRRRLEERGIGYVLGVASNRKVTCPAGRLEARQIADLREKKGAFTMLSAGAGSKGERYYHWALIEIENPGEEDMPGSHHLLIRLNAQTRELAYYLTYSPTNVPLARLVAVAGRRWRVEESFQTSKELTELDEHQVRTWTSWHRWVTSVMWSYAILVAATLQTRAAEGETAGMVRLSVNEQRHLIHIAQHAPDRADHAHRYSRWRRRHQHRAPQSHQKRRQTDLRL